MPFVPVEESPVVGFKYFPCTLLNTRFRINIKQQTIKKKLQQITCFLFVLFFSGTGDLQNEI